jgi:hypothetical protein
MLQWFRAFNPQQPLVRTALAKLQAVRAPVQPADGVLDGMLRAIPTGQNDQSVMQLVLDCARIEMPEAPTVAVSEFQHLAPSMLHVLLNQLILIPKFANTIIDTVIRNLDPRLNVPDSAALVLLHMLTVFVSSSPVFMLDRVEVALNAVKPYYLRPKPVGSVAQRVLRMLTLEQGSPGASLRALCESTAAVDRTLHLLMPAGVMEKLVADFIRAGAAREPSTRQVRQMLIQSVMTRVLGADVAGMLASASAESVNNVYTSMIEILGQSVVRVDDADNYRSSQLRALLQTIQGEANSGGGAQRVPPARAPPMMDIAITPLDTDTALDNAQAIGDTRFPSRRALAAVTHVLMPHLQLVSPLRRPVVRLMVGGGDAALHVVTSAIVVLRLTKPQLFVDLDVRLYVLPTGAESNFASYLAHVDPWYGRHVLFGVQAALRTFPLCELSAAEAAAAASAPSNRVAPGAPIGAELGQAIAARSRIVAPASRGNPIGQPANANQPGGTGQTIDSLWPAALLYTQLSHYARFADNVLPVNLYKCELHVVGGNTSQAVSVPFLSRAEIGQAAVARAHQASAGLDAAMSIDDIVASKGFKFTAPVVSLVFKHMNVRGISRDAEPVKAQPYHSLILSNHWQPNEKVEPAGDPTVRWLELYAFESDSKKKRREAFVHHVGQVEIEADAKRPFEILLDSVLYGPVMRAVIKPLDLPSDDGMFQLPIATFLPLNNN